MKERIEKKLGCTIDEYFAKIRQMNRECMKRGVCAEIPSLLSTLDDEEMDFVEEYIKNRAA